MSSRTNPEIWFVGMNTGAPDVVAVPLDWVATAKWIGPCVADLYCRLEMGVLSETRGGSNDLNRKSDVA